VFNPKLPIDFDSHFALKATPVSTRSEIEALEKQPLKAVNADDTASRFPTTLQSFTVNVNGLYVYVVTIVVSNHEADSEEHLYVMTHLNELADRFTAWLRATVRRHIERDIDGVQSIAYALSVYDPHQ